jgi:hypothetical protein
MRIEDLSHVLAWTMWSLSVTPAEGHGVDLVWVTLPRLKLNFHARADPSGQLRLYSLDHAHLFVSNLQPAEIGVMRGVPHSLIMQDAHGELAILVPCFKVVRPVIDVNPFSTLVVINKADYHWLNSCATRYFLYPVHVSSSFLLAPTLASSLYLLLLRFLAREHTDAFRLAANVGTDAQLSPQERQIFDAFGDVKGSGIHPEAHAVRCKVSLHTLDSPLDYGWYVPTEAALYLCRRSRISATCRLSDVEEELLMKIMYDFAKLSSAMPRQISLPEC